MNTKMDSKSKHPFAITCRRCGGNDVEVRAFDWGELTIKCNDCGCYVECGTYCTKENDYSGATF